MIFPLHSESLVKTRKMSSERTSMFVLAAYVVIAILPGSLAGLHSSRRDGPLVVEYNSAVLQTHPTLLRVIIAPRPGDNQAFTVCLESDFLDNVRFSDVQPTPLGSHSAHGTMMFDFAARGNGQPDTVLFEIKHDRAGPKHGEIGVNGGSRVDFEQMVIPQ